MPTDPLRRELLASLPLSPTLQHACRQQILAAYRPSYSPLLSFDLARSHLLSFALRWSRSLTYTVLCSSSVSLAHIYSPLLSFGIIRSH